MLSPYHPAFVMICMSLLNSLIFDEASMSETAGMPAVQAERLVAAWVAVGTSFRRSQRTVTDKTAFPASRKKKRKAPTPADG